MTVAQLVDLENALEKVPRKGETDWPMKKWFVHVNVHGWATRNGYLSGAVFKQRRRRNKTRYTLALVGECPWNPRFHRYYRVSLTPDVWL